MFVSFFSPVFLSFFKYERLLASLRHNAYFCNIDIMRLLIKLCIRLSRMCSHKAMYKIVYKPAFKATYVVL